jgi:uncharacterized membrane protein YccC
MMRIPLPSRAASRQAIRMTVAAVLAFIATRLTGLPDGQWAVITCVVVVQGSLGGTLDAGLARLYGTLAGAAFGGAGAWLRVRFDIGLLPILPFVIGLPALLATSSAKFRLAPVTAAIVVLGVPDGDPGLTVAFLRVAEIMVGSVIGVLTAMLVLPGRGATTMHEQGAAVLATLGRVAKAHLSREGGEEALNTQVRLGLDRANTAAKEAMRERAVRLSGGPPPAPLMRNLYRLRTDVAMLGRAVAEAPDHVADAALMEAVSDWFAAAGQALAQGSGPPDDTALRAAASKVAPGTPLGFAVNVLLRDAGDLAERLAERAG